MSVRVGVLVFVSFCMFCAQCNDFHNTYISILEKSTCDILSVHSNINSTVQNPRCENQIDELCREIEKTINHNIQNTLNTLEKDGSAIVDQIDSRLTADRYVPQLLATRCSQYFDDHRCVGNNLTV